MGECIVGEIFIALKSMWGIIMLNNTKGEYVNGSYRNEFCKL